MSSAMATAAVPTGFGFSPMIESKISSSRGQGVSLSCAGASSGLLPQRPAFGSSLEGLYSRHIPSLRNALHNFHRHHKTRYSCPRAINVTAGQSDDPQKLDIGGFISALTKLWDSFPQPVRNFPWTRAVISFLQLIFGLTWAVVKYLSIPVLAVSSLSEMSYCAHERKMSVIPIPLFSGLAVAGALEDTAIELSPDLKEKGFPGHLLLIACFFLLLKLPGPYYPYWGRLIIPHFANGGLWRIAWSAFVWYRQPQQSTGKAMEVSVGDNPPKDGK